VTGGDQYTLARKLRESPEMTLFRGFRNRDRLPVVLKVLSSEYPRPKEIARLKHEHAILRSFDSPRVVRTFGLERLGNGMALVLEDVGERSLDHLVGEARPDLEGFLRTAIAMAEVVELVHAQKIIHKDIKPHHFFLSGDGGDVKLIDFGLATRLAHEARGASEALLFEGTLAYMSPEQTGRMNRLIDRRSDLYSLGVTLYELLTGALPFDTADPLELVHSHVARPPRPVRELRPGVPDVLAQIIHSLLCKEPEERYQSAASLRADLETCLEVVRATGTIAAFALGRRNVSGELRISQRLYGRDAEMAVLLAGWERARGGAAELVLVAGSSGVGKSALVGELRKWIVRGGHMAAGKFEERGGVVPYAAIARACRQRLSALLAEPPRELAAWKQRLAGAVGPNGQLLTELMPALELLLGRQAEVEQLGPQESQHRFELVFGSFLQALATPAHPLVLVLDDLHWADAASLRLLELALTDPRSGHLLVIAAYRQGEVTADHPVSAALRRIKEAGVAAREVTLGPLELAHVAQLLGDTLAASPEDVAPLAAVLLRKTMGSPFFLGQFLLLLHQQSLVWLDPEVAGWRWDLDGIERASVTENVADFLIGRLRRLAPATRNVLRLGACLSHQFDLRTLHAVSGADHAEIAAGLREAVSEGLLLPVQEGPLAARDDAPEELDLDLGTVFRFQHDRVQNAAYQLIDGEERRAVHLRIGRHLRDRSGGASDDEQLFAVVTHMNLGRALITDPAERHELARLNATAGRRAKDAAAYRAAITLLDVSLELEGEGDWDSDHDLLFAVHVAKAECEALTGNVDEALRFTRRLSERARSLAEGLRIAELEVAVLTGADRVAAAVARGIEGVRQAGLELPGDRAAVAAAVAADFPALAREVAARGVTALADLPAMTDPAGVGAVGLIFRTMPAVIQSDPNLLVLITLRAVELSLRLGNAPASAYYYVAFGLSLGTVAGDMETAYRLGRMGVSLAERLGNRIVAGASYLLFGGFISPWREHLLTSVEHLRQGRKALLDSGDHTRLGYGVSYELAYRLLQGDDLDELEASVDEGQGLLRRIGDVVNLRATELVRRTIFELRRVVGGGPAARPDDALDQAIFASGNRYLLCTRHLYRAMTLYFGGDFAGAHAEAEAAAAHPVLGSFFTAEQCFYGALALAGRARAAAADEREPLLAPLRAAEEKLRGWAEAGPANFAHRHALVAAEHAALTGRSDEALDLYERAMLLARDGGAVHHQALAADLAARFHRARGRERLAGLYQADARYAHERWGAAGEAPGAAVGGDRRLRRTSTASSAPEQIDVLTVTRAAQAISTEIVLPKLVEALMRIVVEQAGADRGLLMLVRDGALWVEGVAGDSVARGRLDDGDAEATDAVAPRSVLAYARRTRKAVLLANARGEHTFAADPYFALRKPRSLLCLPMTRRGQLVGLLYLENSLTAEAFTDARVTTLEVLASQAAISIENAMLYEEMESRAHLEREMAIAQHIQTSILPKGPTVPGFEIAGRMATASEVGGDYYDVFPAESGGLWIGIGDVSGHGLNAGLMMLMIQSSVAALVRRDPDGDPGAVLRLVNRVLYENVRRRLGGDDHATLSLLHLEVDGWFQVAGAHEEMLIWRAGEGRCARIPTSGTWVGVVEDIGGYTETSSHHLAPGDVLVLYSDGLIEAMKGRRQFSIASLMQAVEEVHDRPAAAICDHLFQRVAEWTAARDDDQTAIVIRYTGLPRV
jgi:predicted ATPase/serine phosphatase RsbU (regulator of sigma subunit)